MTDTLHPSSTTQSGAVAALAGVLAGESDGDITVRTSGGTWTFRRRDVLAIRELDNQIDLDTVLLEIRPGSTAEFTRPVRVDIGERPMTLAAPVSEVVGDEPLRLLTESWAARLGLGAEQIHPAIFTRAHTRSSGAGGNGIHCDSLD